MTLDPRTLQDKPDFAEAIEKATLRMVVQAVYEFSGEASLIFRHEPDLAGDIGEDITREALDRMGTSMILVRLYGKIDYKKARYVFHPDYSLRQALFVDSKAEKVEGSRTATIQTAQTSLKIRQRLPNGMLQERYNPNADDTIWLAGRNAPSRREAFRVRISLSRLKAKTVWRVQHILLAQRDSFLFGE